MELFVNQVTMQFQEKYAVDHVSFSIQQGVHVLMGKNGAGKSTLLRIVSGVLKPSGGTVTLESKNRFPSGYGLRSTSGTAFLSRAIRSSEEEYRNILGYLPQEFGCYPEFTGKDFLLYLASLKGLTKKQALGRAKELLALVSMEDAANKKVKTYSSGMKQRLGFAQTLLNNPKLLVMDEPTAGLDPVEQINFLNLIKKIGKDRIVLLSAHTVTEVEYIADSVLFMKNGRLIFQGKPEEQHEGLEKLFFRYMSSPEE